MTTDIATSTVVPGMASELVVPLRHKARSIGALNVLSHRKDQFSSSDAALLRQFGAHVVVALVNARLFEQSRTDAAAFETLAEIGARGWQPSSTSTICSSASPSSCRA